MGRGLRAQVGETDTQLVLVDALGRNAAGDDLTEETIGTHNENLAQILLICLLRILTPSHLPIVSGEVRSLGFGGVSAANRLILIAKPAASAASRSRVLRSRIG
jgi:hypothetical protein